jgi:hypothetical protein
VCVDVNTAREPWAYVYMRVSAALNKVAPLLI